MRPLATVVLLGLFLGVSCLTRAPFSSPLGMKMETRMEKNTLGSSPPRCHNKCNYCNPCMAVQVPATLGQARPFDAGDTPFAEFSNYKPLGWKCRCNNRFYDP